MVAGNSVVETVAYFSKEKDLGVDMYVNENVFYIIQLLFSKIYVDCNCRAGP